MPCRAASSHTVVDELEERVKGMRLQLALDAALRSGNMPPRRTSSENDAHHEPQRPAKSATVAGKRSAKPSYRDFIDLVSKGDDDSFGKLVSRLKPNAGRKQDAGSTTSTATAAGTPKERPPPATILRRCSSTPEGATDRGQEEHEREWGSEPSARNVRFASTHQVRIIPRRLLPFDA
eukprot:CAMPEP_0180159766 /NCGR_PEP_ID=MMETSP0986-20121125/27716_1 /TAXON_ID=697907 /ORGANISM="non described non described, Strain CCMP2293" /LENGTH=177 /DNA_ID=CAMNT_0022109907 /DNA_START=18 /DNA_END=551 /DNA_ORIENTATION=+